MADLRVIAQDSEVDHDVVKVVTVFKTKVGEDIFVLRRVLCGRQDDERGVQLTKDIWEARREQEPSFVSPFKSANCALAYFKK